MLCQSLPNPYGTLCIKCIYKSESALFNLKSQIPYVLFFSCCIRMAFGAKIQRFVLPGIHGTGSKQYILYVLYIDRYEEGSLQDYVSDGSGLKPGPGPARSPGSKARPELDFWQRAQARARPGPLLKSPGALKGF